MANTIATNWTLVDTAATLNGAVVAAPCKAQRTMKYTNFYAPAVGGYIASDCWETWNPVTHTGTNQSYPFANNSWLPYSTTAVNLYYIIVQPSMVLVCNSSSAGSRLIGSMEIARDAGYLINSSYPVHFSACNQICSNATGGYGPHFCRIKNLFGAGDWVFSLAASELYAIPPFRDLPYSLPIVDDLGVPYHPMYPLWVSRSTSSQSAVLGRLLDCALTTYNFGAVLDEVVDGPDTYIVIGLSSHGLVKKG